MVAGAKNSSEREWMVELRGAEMRSMWEAKVGSMYGVRRVSSASWIVSGERGWISIVCVEFHGMVNFGNGGAERKLRSLGVIEDVRFYPIWPRKTNLIISPVCQWRNSQQLDNVL